jgi:hypothetical protein
VPVSGAPGLPSRALALPSKTPEFRLLMPVCGNVDLSSRCSIRSGPISMMLLATPVRAEVRGQDGRATTSRMDPEVVALSRIGVLLCAGDSIWSANERCPAKAAQPVLPEAPSYDRPGLVRVGASTGGKSDFRLSRASVRALGCRWGTRLLTYRFRL